MSTIHPTAIVDKGAELGTDVEIGAYCIVGPNVKIGAKTQIMPHAFLHGHTEIGIECAVYPFASIGTPAQSLKHRGAKTSVIIGDRTTLREYTTVNAATEEETATVIGNDCFMMAYCHAAHDCKVGNGVIMANMAQLAGHVIVEDMASLGGMVGVHQFTRIGKMSFVGAYSRVTQDVPPYLIVEGIPAVPYGLNSVGLRRKNMPEEVRSVLKEAYRILYREGLSTRQAIDRIRAELEICPELDHFLKFIESAERGIVK